MSNLTAYTTAILERISNLNPNAGEIGAGMLRNIVSEARAALDFESAPRFRVLSNGYDFDRNEIVCVPRMNPTKENGFTVEAFSVSRVGVFQRIPDAELCPLE